MQVLFLELVKLSLIGSLFALAVMLVRLVFKKAPKWIFCILWGIVALRLIVPISIESDLSVIPDRLATGQIITNVGSIYIDDVDIIYESNAGYSNAVEAGRQPIYSNDGYYVVTEKDSLEAPKTVGETVYPILSWVWVAGMVLMLSYTAISYLVLKRKMVEATLLRDNIWQCEQADSPFVLGIIRPRIYLPYQISESDMANVIAHEQAHIRRKDHWWKPIGFLLLSIHWFNPVMWLAYILLCRDIEAACDEKVIKHMEKEEMRAYSTALLHCSIHRRRIAACPLAFGETGVKERIKRVMNYKKPAFWIIVVALIVCVVIAVCFLTNPKDSSSGVLPNIHSHAFGARFDSTVSSLGGADDPITTYSEVKLTEKTSDSQESSYKVSAGLQATDLSAPGQVLADKIKSEWNTFDRMTQQEQWVSSHLWGTIYVNTETWKECGQAIGFTIDNPLESIGWINKTGYFGMESADPSTPVTHVQATAYATHATDRKLSKISVTAGYNKGDVRITLTATISATAGNLTTGSITRGYATYEQDSLTTGSGAPVLVVTTNETNNTGYYIGDFFDPTAYWVKDNVFYTLRVFGDAADQAEIQETLELILAEI